MTFSNFTVGLINIATAIVSIPIVATGVQIRTASASTVGECEKFLQTPFLAIGIFLLVLSLFGIIGSCCRLTGFLWIYLFVMFLLILFLCFFNMFAFALSSKGDLQETQFGILVNKRLDEYSAWIRAAVEEKGNWYKIKRCLMDADACQDTFEVYIHRKFPYAWRSTDPIQDGCCKPPTGCGFVWQKGVSWSPPQPGFTPASTIDCNAWSNDLETLCFDCDECKAGFLASVNTVLWKRLTTLSAALLVFLILVYSLGCCALRNSQRGGYRRHFNP